MPRIPVYRQETEAPGVPGNSPRAQAADFGGGLGGTVAELGAATGTFGRMLKARQRREAERKRAEQQEELDQKQAERDAQAGEPDADQDSATRVEQGLADFDETAAAILRQTEDPGVRAELAARLPADRAARGQVLLRQEAETNLQRDLDDTAVLLERHARRVERAPGHFADAARLLLGDEDEDGLLADLPLRPEARRALSRSALSRLLTAQLAGDPEAVSETLSSGRWDDLLSAEERDDWQQDAARAVTAQESQRANTGSQSDARQALELRAGVAAGSAGYAAIRQAQADGWLPVEQAAALRAELAAADAVRQSEERTFRDLKTALAEDGTFDATTPEGQAALEAFYDSHYEALLEGELDETKLAQVGALLTKTGRLPTRLSQELTGALEGGDGARQLAAAQVLQQLQEAAPEAVATSLDAETRARAQVLARESARGLAPAEALRRAEEILAAGVFDPETLAALQRDFDKAFEGLGEGRTRLLNRRLLEGFAQLYRTRLAAGDSPEAARREVERGVGQVFSILSQRDARFDKDFSELGSDRARLQQVKLSPREKSKGNRSEGQGWWRRWRPVVELLYDFVSVISPNREEALHFLIESFPEVEGMVGHALVSLGDDKIHMGEIVEENRHAGTRVVKINHPKLGHVRVLQSYDMPGERYYTQSVNAFYEGEFRDFKWPSDTRFLDRIREIQPESSDQ